MSVSEHFSHDISNSTDMSLRTPLRSQEAHVICNIAEKCFSNDIILKNICFSVKNGEFLTIAGPSGCGKTTLLRIIAGLDRHFDGEVIVAGHSVRGPGRDRGIVFQESRLVPWFTARENVAFALADSIPRSNRKERSDRALRLVNMLEVADRLPFQLSGGMAKRVALARAIINLPQILLLDEPLSSLDMVSQQGLQEEIASIQTREQLTTILVTHDVDEAIYLSDRILVLSGVPATLSRQFTVSIPRPRRRVDVVGSSLRESILEALLSRIPVDAC